MITKIPTEHWLMTKALIQLVKKLLTNLQSLHFSLVVFEKKIPWIVEDQKYIHVRIHHSDFILKISVLLGS